MEQKKDKPLQKQKPIQQNKKSVARAALFSLEKYKKNIIFPEQSTSFIQFRSFLL